MTQWRRTLSFVCAVLSGAGNIACRSADASLEGFPSGRYPAANGGGSGPRAAGRDSQAAGGTVSAADAGAVTAGGDHDAAPPDAAGLRDAAPPDAELGDDAGAPSDPRDGGAAAPAHATFPLRLSPNRRYLVGANGAPFLIKEIQAWGLIQALSESDATAFMDAARSMGFNTLMVSAISSDKRFTGGPPSWNGVSPFHVRWDFSSYNLSYFEHVDRVLKAALERGMLVLLVPCYLGYPGDGSQGWWDELQSANNDPDKTLAYGMFLGQRYRDVPNIVWEAGGDNSATGSLQPHLLNLIRGIKQHDADHLWTGHFDATSGMVWATDNAPFASYIDLDALYAFAEDELGASGPQYAAELTRYARGKLIFQLDQSYEHDVPHGTDNEDSQWIRRKNYDGLLSGCAGTSFSPGTRDNQLYTFSNWRPLMDTPGMHEARITFDLFESRDWWRLIPERDAALIVDGRGMEGSVDYACAARSENHDTAIVYLPSSRSLTLDLSAISGSSVVAWWYSPTSGESTRIAELATAGKHTFMPPAAGDWVLVLDDAVHPPRAPGREH